MNRVQRTEALLVLSVVSELEARVRHERENDLSELQRIDELLSDVSVQVVPVTRGLARHAAVVRARHRLSLADAIIVATAEIAGSHVIVGNDRQWRGRTVVPFLYLDDLVSSP